MNSRKAVFLAVVAANFILFVNSAYSAQAVEEVLVTATKRSENLQEVPLTITAFTAETIKDAGIERPADFIALTPNVSMVQTANAGDSQVTIRGIVSTRDAESTFAYVVDGVLMTNPNGFNQELFDLKQIEVVKGPQGALYGRNAVAGAILVTTQQPTDQFEAKLKGGYGNDHLEKFGGNVSGPLSDKVKAGLAVNSRTTNGEYKNDYTGEDSSVDYLRDKAARARFIIDPTTDWQLDTQIGYRNVEGGAINFNAAFQLPGAAAFLGVPQLDEDVNDHDFRYINNVPGKNKQTDKIFSIKSDYEMDWAIATTVLAYDKLEEWLLSDGTSAAFGGYSFGAPASASACLNSYNAASNDMLNGQKPFYGIQNGNPPGSYIPAGGLGPGSPQTLNALLPPYSSTTCDGYQYQERNQTSKSGEFRLTSTDPGPVKWIAGIYYLNIDREVAVSYGADLDAGYDANPYVSPTGPNPTDQLFWDDFTTDVYSTFGQLDWDFVTDQTLTLALRWDQEQRDVSNKVPNTTAPQIYGGIPPLANRPINPAFTQYPNGIPDRNKTYTQFEPKVAWSWNVNDDLTTYASYAVGFRSGGFNSLGSEDTVNNAFGSFATGPKNVRDEYDKEVSKQFEAGVKSEWLDRSLRVNASAFHTEVKDNQFFNFFVGNFGLLRVVTNIDEVHINGFEVDSQYLITDEISFNASYGLISSEIKENKNRTYTEGNDVPLAPDSTGSLGLQFKDEVSSGMDLVARADWVYTGKTWFSDVQDDTTTNSFTDLTGVYPQSTPPFGFGQSNFKNSQRDSFDVVNMRLGLEGEHWSVTAWSDNVFDEDYLAEVIPAPEFGGSFIHPGAGRMYGVDVSYKF